ncbi:MAG: tetratricopeptide repeat protein [Proteobacteria bacterium]|nr:tetratricopeptide repeat protein [Pseudomonadota bacterium]
MRRLGRYEVGDLLGEGGSGRVFDAMRVGPGGMRKRVALKVLHDGAPGLAREARLGGLLRHDNLVDVYEVGEANGTWFCALERCEGKLSSHLPLPPRAVVEVGLQVCAALRYAHEELSLVHLDIKPDNLLFDAKGTVKVGDLGIARAEGFGADGRVRGTPGYMSPEQLRGDAVDARADIFALGRTLIELAQGHQRVAAPTFVLDPVDDTDPDPSVPSWIDSVVSRCVALAPVDRWQSMAEVAEALRAVVADGPGLSEVLGLSAVRETRLDGLDLDDSAFVGRDKERAGLATALLRPGIVVVRGPAGIGKSRLAAEAVHDWRKGGAGAWRCDLAHAHSEEGLLFAVARTLQVPLGKTQPAQQLGAALAARGDAVLLLDNFGQLAPHRAVVERWAERAPNLRLLLTSRRSLGPGLRELVLAPMPTADGVALLIHRAQRRGAELTETQALRELAHRLDGLPLALELAAGRLGVLSVEDVLERLSLDLLRDGSADRHGTLSLALDLSWDLLSETERSGLTQLAVFAGGFTIDRAEEVVQTEASVVDVVQALLDHSLLRVAGRDRFELPHSVAEYARARGMDGNALERHGEAFAALGRRSAIDALDTHGGVTRRSELSADLDNLVTACRRAVDRRNPRVAVFTLRAARRVLDEQGPHAAAKRVTDEVLAMPGLSGLWLAYARYLRGMSRHHEGRIDEAMTDLRAAETALELSDERSGLARVRVAVGRIHRDQGRLDESIAAYEQAVATYELVGDLRGAASTQAALGLLYIEQGDMGRAGAILKSARQTLTALGDRRGQARASSSIGILHAEQGRLAQARSAFQLAADAFREVHSGRDLAIVMGNLANVQADSGDHEGALATYEEALDMHREVGNRRFEGIVLANWGALLQEMGRIADARQIAERALAVNREIGDRRVEGTVLGNLGVLMALQRQPEQAKLYLEAALEVAREVRDRRFEAYWLSQLARLSITSTENSLALLDEGESLYRDMGAVAGLAELIAIRAEVLWRTGQGQEARRCLIEAYEVVPVDHAEARAEIDRVKALIESEVR